ncbi:MAG: hypothetical protein AAB074_07615 [Planctomycetota bacterium]
MKSFIPATDEVHTLHRNQGPAGKHFRLVSEKGHYAGNPMDATRQGIYALAPSGEFLASVNSTSADAVERMLKEALKAWEDLPKDRRLLKEKPEEIKGRWEDRYPGDGMALRVYSRDLPREKKFGDWRDPAWNIDYAWFLKDEMTSWMPESTSKGAYREVPEALVRRLVRCHFVDNVRGQTNAFPDEAVKQASLKATIESVKGDRVTVRYEGPVELVHKGRWAADDTGEKDQERGYRGTILGRGVWSLQGRRFISLDLTSTGTRWGGTRYNFRNNDFDPAPMGYAIQLAPDTPTDRMVPASIGDYGW